VRHGIRSASQMVVLAAQQPFERIAQIAEQMPAVGNLHRLRRALPRRLRIGPATIPANDLYLRMRLQPGSHRGGGAVRQQVDHPVRFQVHQDRAVGVPLAARPVINPQDADGARW